MARSRRGNATGSYAAAVKLVAGQPVGRFEGGDTPAKRALLALEPLGLGFAGAKFEQKPLYQRGYGRFLHQDFGLAVAMGGRGYAMTFA